MCKCFVSPRNGQALLGMPELYALNIINININTIDRDDGRDTDNYYTNKANLQRTHMTQETDIPKKCYTNPDSTSKSDNTEKSMVNNKLSNTTDYFLPGPNHDKNRRVSVKITQQL